jgi:hypothetical protein
MRPALPPILETLSRQAQARGVTGAEWAELAGIRPETLSRLAQRSDCDLQTIANLAAAVGFELALRPRRERAMPATYGRKQEEQLLALCASRGLDLAEWMAAGPRYFMAGLATLLSGLPGFDAEGLLLVAEALHPGMTELPEYQGWLDESPLKPSRFLPMLKARISQGAVAA